MNPVVLALIALLGLGLFFLIRLKGGQLEKTEIPCDGEEEFEANPAADTQFVVIVDQACADEVKIQVGLETWTDVVVLRPPTTGTEVRRENPKPGSAYFVTVPRGQKLKVLCPPGTNNNKCIVRVANLSAQPRNPIAVNKPANPVTTTCSTWTEARLYNLGTKPALVRIRFTKVCNDPHGPQRAPEVRTKRILGLNLEQTDSLPAATQDGNVWKWDSSLPKENVLEVRCPGSDNGCEFNVQIVG